MKKFIFGLLVANVGLAFADNTASAPISSSQGVVNGLYKSTQSSTFIKIGNSNESGLTFPVVASRRLENESDTTQHGVSFDERLFFKKVNATTYISTDPEDNSGCVATLNKVNVDSFTIKVNSIDNCFNKYSQFNTEAPDKDQSKAVAPFLGVTFKLDSSSKDVQRFSSF